MRRDRFVLLDFINSIFSRLAPSPYLFLGGGKRLGRNDVMVKECFKPSLNYFRPQARLSLFAGWAWDTNSGDT